MKVKIKKLPAWLIDNQYGVKVGLVVDYFDGSIEHNGFKLRLGKTYVSEIAVASPKQAYEWAKTGHWSFAEFNEWLNQR